jgi:multisubunit Na+/H+ antiporter MnhE subunit
VPTAVFTVLVFVGYVLLSDSSVVTSLVKALVVGAIFSLVKGWLVRRQTRRRDET